MAILDYKFGLARPRPGRKKQLLDALPGGLNPPLIPMPGGRMNSGGGVR